MRFDVLIRDGSVVLDDRVEPMDLGIGEGSIAALGPQLEGTADEVIDASGLHVLPGVLDSHVHFNEPGRDSWEGIATGSAALAAGGGTCFFDMPLNSSPPTTDGEAFDVKRETAERQSVTDFGLWGGLIPGDLDRLDELADRGVVGFKAFMADTGVDDFPRADDLTLLRGMERAASLGLPVAVHAESEELTARLVAAARDDGRRDISSFIESRPVLAEVEAVQRAVLFAEEAGCPLHIVHVSSGRALAVIAEARARGVDVSCETGPHYLLFTTADAERIGALAKCAPPVRERADVEALWKGLQSGVVDFVASDHSPSEPAMKDADDFFDVWGGIAGCQSTLGVMVAEGREARDIPLPAIGRWVAAAPARRYRIAGKGRIAEGFDADLAIVDLAGGTRLRSEDLLYRHRQSPYVGLPVHGYVRRTLVRGTTVWREGRLTGQRPGRLVRPGPR